MPKMCLRPGLRADPAGGAYTALPQTPMDLRGLLLRGGDGS